MNRKTSFLTVLALCAIATTLSSKAQSQTGDIREYVLDTIVGVAEPLRIGVNQMSYIGTRYITPDDSSFMRYATLVVQRDVDFYADFQLVLVDSLYLSTYSVTDVDLVGWQRMGAEYLVRLEAEFPGQNMRVFWRIYNTSNRRQVASGTVEENRQSWRELAHDISNEVVRYLTGNTGIFRTKIVFVAKVNGSKEVFIADYNGSNTVQLTQTGSTNLSPFLSPDGRAVYFTSYMSGDPQLHKVDVVTHEITQITKFQGVVAAPSVSPDGRKIALVLSKDKNSEIYVIDLNGNIIKRLTRHRAIESAPTWSPDGDSLAFSSDRTGAPQIYIMDADGLSTRRLTYQGNYNDSPIWAAEGDRIIFVSRTRGGRFDLASIRTDGADFRRLTEVGRNENPHFAPDGKHIVFSSTRLSAGDIYSMDISGRNQRRITRNGACSNPSWGPFPE